MPRVLKKSIWPYALEVTSEFKTFWGHNHVPYEKWCRANKIAYYRVGDTFYFQTEKELIHFSLVWQ